MPEGGTFEARVSRYVDIGVIVVSHQSAADLSDLIADLRREASDLTLRLVVVDNDSSDGSHRTAAAHEDVIAVASGGNVGYAGAINIGSTYVGPCTSRLILNPDLRLVPGSLRTLLTRLTSSSEIGAVVPRISDEQHRLYPSVRYEPSVPRAVGDALFGSHWPSRPAWARETEYEVATYDRPRPIDWATGAALLIRSTTAEEIGPWDESFFLYSEEIDYMYRIRSAGMTVWFEPAAEVIHRQGGSGASPELSALLTVNRVRYFSRRHGPLASEVFRAACLVGSWLRLPRSSARREAFYLRSSARWPALPGPTVRTHPVAVNAAD